MKKHLDKFHRGWGDMNQQGRTSLQSLVQTRISSNGSDSLGLDMSTCPAVPLNPNQYNKLIHLITLWVIDSGQPFSEIERDSFLDMFHYLIRGFELKSRQTLQRNIVRLYETKRNDLATKFLLLTSKASVTCDLWTSSSRTPFVGIAVHFIEMVDNKYQLVSLVHDMRFSKTTVLDSLFSSLASGQILQLPLLSSIDWLLIIRLLTVD
ncbi:hypothetical protein RCL1_008185 [Eukaryota sp. TZLM3-RCL]